MSTVYTGHKDGSSLDCKGAINGNTDTHWHNNTDKKPNCIFTEKYAYPAYWILDLGKSRTINKITIYHVEYYPENDYSEYMKNASVTVDGIEIFKYSHRYSEITNPMHITKGLPVAGQIVKIERTTRYESNYVPLWLEDEAVKACCR
nr:hypothetical protein BaRGS_004473 [Batillaria attramentaria]